MKKSTFPSYQWDTPNLSQTGVLVSYRLCTIDCLDDIVQAVNQSALPNIAQLVGTHEGTTVVPMYE